MKKNIIRYISFCLLMAFACNESEDILTADAQEGGAIVSVGGTTGKVLGIPAESGEVTFTDNDLSLKIAIATGGDQVVKYDVVKMLNGGEEVIVGEFTPDQIPGTLELTTLQEFLNGTGKTEDDLRIGDVFTFVVRMHLNDGRIIYAGPSNGRFSTTVNCSSNLAGTYVVTGLYNRSASGIVNQPVGPRTEVITEVGAGVYQTQLTGHWALADLGVSACPIIFGEVCGELTIDTQYLCDYYSNEVSGSGAVDPETGNLHFEYIITGGNERSYTFDFVKQ